MRFSFYQSGDCFLSCSARDFDPEDHLGIGKVYTAAGFAAKVRNGVLIDRSYAIVAVVRVSRSEPLEEQRREEGFKREKGFARFSLR